jgi:hypothetical protein
VKILKNENYSRDASFDNTIDPITVWKVWKVMRMAVVKTTTAQTHRTKK